MKKKSILFGERVEKKDPNDPKDLGWMTLYDSRKENPKLNETTLLGKKSVIVFPGDGASTEREANGCCGAMKDMLLAAGVSPKDLPHFYGLAYQGGEQDKHRYQILTQLKQAQFGSEYVSDPPKEPPYYQPFFDEYILPLMVDEKGNPRPVSEIRKNIQNVTFATHCHGGFVAWQIEKMMAEKLAEFYPKQMPELMSNVRMIHFSSRRPSGQISYGKHLDIISQNDDMYADGEYLEYDNIYKQIHRTAIKGSALISVSPNEEILLLEKLISEGVYDDDPEHSEILHIFAGEPLSKEHKDLIPNPKNKSAIQFTCQLLRHFVEHPDDKEDIQTQLEKLNPSFAKENIKRSKNFLAQEKEDEKVRRGLLSLISTWGERWGAHLARREKVYRSDGTVHSVKTRKKNVFLRQRSDEGSFLYGQLKKNYLATGNSLSLIHFIQDIGPGFLPEKERGDLILFAVQNHDWRFFDAIGGKKGCLLGQIEKEAVPKIISSVESKNLYRLFTFLENNLRHMDKDSVLLLMNKIKKVKNVVHQEKLKSVLKKALQTLDKSSLKGVLSQASMQGKKTIKSLIAQKRQEEANILITRMQDRDEQAPDLTLKEIDEFDPVMRNWNASLTDLSQFKSAQKKDKNLSFDTFMMNRRKTK